MIKYLVDPRRWPLHVKVPLIVAILMIGVSASISEVVLGRLADSQEKNVQHLTAAYLEGLSAAVIPHLARRDVWETYDALDRAGQHHEALKARYTIVAFPDGHVLAASDPERFPVDSMVPADLLDRFEANDGFVADDEASVAWARESVATDGVELGYIVAEIDLSEQLIERKNVLFTLVLVNGFLTFGFAAAGYLVALHLLRPVSVLSSHIEEARHGSSPTPIPAEEIDKHGPEFRKLFERFNTMVEDIDQRGELAQRLADEEKLALLGKLASGLAHEVNNPLGGMMNAVDTIRKHGDDPDVRRTSLGLLERGLEGIRNVVRATLVTYKGGNDPTQLTHRDIEDLRYLVHHQAVRRHVELNWQNDIADDIPIDGAAVRQSALNLLLNACAASPRGGKVTFHVKPANRVLSLTISDEGAGLPVEVLELLTHATRDMAPPSGSRGLGAWTAARLIAQIDGAIEVLSNPRGTRIVIAVPIESSEVFDAVA